jgi:hypothetical protein
MRSIYLLGWALLGSSLLSFAAAAQGQPQGQPVSAPDAPTDDPKGSVPRNTILVKGAWSSASDATTPLPEGGRIDGGVYINDYFGLTYKLATHWEQNHSGPPPSDSGYYVLGQLESPKSSDGTLAGNMLIAAQDMFFTPTPASNALELVTYTKDHLGKVFKVERAPTQVQIANHSFIRFDYTSPVAGLHWYVLATQIRCHMVEFVLTSRDPKLAERLIKDMNTLQLPADAGADGGKGGGGAPVCIKDYASPENTIARENPISTDRRFNPVPVRIVIDRDGKVKHIHFLSAFPEQAKTIGDALAQWRFKPYLVDGQAVEVETGIMFGRARRTVPPPQPRSRAGATTAGIGNSTPLQATH